MNIVLVKTDITFKLAPDVFVISKSKATFGGAFSTTKLHWKKNKAALKPQDLQFVSEFFINLGMTRIKQSQEVAGFAARDTQGCGHGTQPPKQTSPFKDEAEDMYDFGPEEFYDTEADDESVGYPDEENVGGYLYDEDIGGSWDENDLNEDEQVGWKKDITK